MPKKNPSEGVDPRDLMTDTPKRSTRLSSLSQRRRTSGIRKKDSRPIKTSKINILADTNPDTILKAIEGIAKGQQEDDTFEYIPPKVETRGRPRKNAPKRAPKPVKKVTASPRKLKAKFQTLEENFREYGALLEPHELDAHCVALDKIPFRHSQPIPSALSSEDSESYFPCSERSAPFRTIISNDIVQLPRFAHCQFQESEKSPAKLLVYTGGSVQCLSWLPVRATYEENIAQTQYVAFGVHQDITPIHISGTKSSYKNMIQIWEFQGLLAPWDSNGNVPPSAFLAIGICHSFGCVLDLQWCPFSSTWEDDSLSSQIKGRNSLGLLAACFTDGSLRVFDVPHPEALSTSEDIHTQYIALEPVMTFMIQDLSISHAKWNVSNQGVDLLFSSSLGFIGLWHTPLDIREIELEANGNVAPTLCFRAHTSQIKDLVWDSRNPNTFITVSPQPPVKVWDRRQPLEPIYHMNYIGHNNCTTVWEAQSLQYYLFGSSAGHVKVLAEGHSSAHMITPHIGAVWSTSASKYHAHMVTSGDDGTVRISYLLDFESKAKRKPKMNMQITTIAKLSKQTDNALLLEFPSSTYTPQKKVKEPALRSFPDRVIGWNCSAFSPNKTNCNWVICGSNLGIACAIPFHSKNVPITTERKPRQ